MFNYKRLSFLSCLFFIILAGNAQDYKLMDSLRKIIPTKSDDDTLKVYLMNSLAFEYSYIDLDSGMRLAITAKVLADKINYVHGQSAIYNTMGTIYHDKGDFQKAVEHYSMARKLAEKTNYKTMLATVFANLGNTYESINDYANAKHYYFESLKMFKELGMVDHFAGTYMNIGVLYFVQNNQDSALYYYNKSLSIPSNNIGQLAILRFNFSESYIKQNKLKKAEQELMIGLKYVNELHSVYYEATFYQQLAKIYILQKKYNEAEKLILKSLNGAKIGKLLSLQTQANYQLYEIYKGKKDYAKALQYHVEYSLLFDSLNNTDRKNAASELEKKYQTEKKQVEIEKLNTEKTISDSESKHKSRLLMFAFIGVSLVLCALGFAIYAFINKQKANKRLEILNREVLNQKDELQYKNKNITDSLHYAQRIQNVLLTSQTYIKENLNEFFILNKPKDIVSGDFYWAVRQNDFFYFMVADCTGHGVPGAFMSLLGINFLNEIVLEKYITSPDKILNHLRAQIMNVFTDKGNSNSQINDGMDCVFCKFDLTNHTLHFAAANNSITIVRGEELIELRGNKMPVGKSPRDEEDFTLQAFQLLKEDCVYIFTDGYADQFGGEDGKKLKVKNLKQVLLTVATKPVEEQKLILNNHFETWKRHLEQVDDVLMVGIRI